MHTHYKGTGKVHSFRGLLADEEQQKIRIQGSVGTIAWRITKFQIMGDAPVTENQESVVKIFREVQSSFDATVNFTDDELLGVAVWSSHSTATNYPEDLSVIFDNSLFVRNIYISHAEAAAARSCNYYIELEEVKVSAAGMAQLAVAAARRTI